MDFGELVTQEWFWAAVTALVALAGLAGGLASWLVATMIKRRERPEPEWIYWADTTAFQDDGPFGPGAGIHVLGSISNAGDGNAFNFRVEGVNCEASFSSKDARVKDRVGLVAAGDVVGFGAVVPFEGWNDASIRFVWTTPPTRLKRKKSLELLLQDELARPTYYTEDSKTGREEERPVP